MNRPSPAPQASGETPKPVIPWTRLTEALFAIGALGHTVVLSGPCKQIMSTWVFIAIVMLPVLILLLFQRGIFSDEVVERAHLLGAIWYLALTTVVIVMMMGGHRARGWWAFLVMIAPAAVISLWVIGRWLRDAPALRSE